MAEKAPADDELRRFRAEAAELLGINLRPEEPASALQPANRQP